MALIVSMSALAYAWRSLPVGTGYAVRVGLGASLAVVYSMVTGSEPVAFLRLALICGLIGCVIKLRLVSAR